MSFMGTKNLIVEREEKPWNIAKISLSIAILVQICFGFDLYAHFDHFSQI